MEDADEINYWHDSTKKESNK